MPRSLTCLIISLVIPMAPIIEAKIPPAAYALAAFGTAWVTGNMYARYIERATHYRFKEEMEQLQDLDGAQRVIAQILQKHHESLNIGLLSRLYKRLHLLPIHSIDTNLHNYPLVQSRKDIKSYLNSIWWSQWWTLFTRKYHDLGALKLHLKQIEDILTADYRYTKELLSLHDKRPTSLLISHH